MNAKTIRTLRRVVQGLALLFFLLLFVDTTFLTTQRAALQIVFYRLDPLVALTASLAARGVMAGFALAFISLSVTLIFGRVWCGWFCPMGTVLDLFSPRRSWRSRPKPPAERWRSLKYLLLLLLVIAALLGSQTFLFLDPITILTRSLADAIWPGLRFAVLQVESLLYTFPFLWPALDTVHAGLVYPLFKDVQPAFTLTIPIFLFFAGLIALNWWAERFWCRYLCPLGGLFGLLSRFSLFRRVVKEGCSNCAACSRHCPTDTIRADQNFASDPAECLVCYDCIQSCPRDVSDFRFMLPRWRPAPGQSYDPGRREAIGALGLAALWASLSGAESIRKRQPAMLVRPPGAVEADFEARCIRCNECVRVCPTQGLQPSFLEGGWQNMLTPRLEPRLGYCSYNCSACGQVCPTGAISTPHLTGKTHYPHRSRSGRSQPLLALGL